MANFSGGQALVIGAGMSGLAAAGALAKHFERVIVLERDGLADGPSHRQGTPQSRQLHGLLPGGLEALCRIFPGFDQDLAAAGAAPVRVAADIREELPGFDPFPRRDFGRVAYCASRPLLEHTLRRRVRALRNVVLRDHRRVVELVASADRRRITGARCERSDGTAETLAADLVVDASARGTLTLAALDAMGCGRPQVTSVGVNIGYATAAFEIPRQRPDWKAVLTFASAPSERRCGFLLPVDGNRWMVCIAELQCPRPPLLGRGSTMDRRGLSMSATPDLAYPQTQGERPADLEDRLSFASALHRVAARDPDVHARLVAVRYLLQPDDALQEPGLVDRVRAEMAAASPPTTEPATRAA